MSPEAFRFDRLARDLLLLNHDEETIQALEALIDNRIQIAYNQGRLDTIEAAL